MAQTSTTLATSSGHKANITGTDISFNEVSGVYKITSTSTALSNIDALDVITVTGTTNNNKTFTVKSRQSANELRVEEIVVDENSDGSTTTTIDYTGFVTDKAKGDGYYSQGDGTHTVAFYVDASLNDDANIKLCMQGSLATTPTESDWFDISGTTIDQNNIDGSTLVFSNNFTGNFFS